MKKKTVGMLVCTLLITAAVLPATGTINIENNVSRDKELTSETGQQDLLGNDFDWEVSGNNVFTGHGGSYPSGNVGIGTNNPLAKFDVRNGAVLFSGTSGGTPTSGGGTRLMWIPAKAAFRAGQVFGDQWDDSNIGSYSVAMGYCTTANGQYGPTAMGAHTKASGIYSTAMGSSTTASGSYSTAMGTHTKASGSSSTAMGGTTTASGIYSMAMGFYTKASGHYSTAMGDSTTASGSRSTAMGSTTTASGSYSTAMGEGTTASGSRSTAMGEGTTASGYGATAMGIDTTANRSYSTAMGSSITVNGNYSVGIGLNSTLYTINPDNVMSIMGGNVGIGTTSPSEKLEVNGNVKATSFLGDGSNLTGVVTTETDPVFTASAAFGISIGDISNWTTAYGWGDHASAGYDTSDDSWIGIGNVYTTSGNVGIGTTSPSYLLDVSGGSGIVAQFSGRVKGADAVNDDEFVTKKQVESISTSHYTPTGSNDPTGSIGDTAWDDNYFYVKTTDGWKRAELETWESSPLIK